MLQADSPWVQLHISSPYVSVCPLHRQASLDVPPAQPILRTDYANVLPVIATVWDRKRNSDRAVILGTCCMGTP